MRSPVVVKVTISMAASGKASAVHFLHFPLDDAAIVLSRAAAREGRSRMQLIEDQARVEEADARRAELSTSASPLLQRIVAGGSLTDAERLGMERAEAEIRDQLVADLLVDADVRVATRRARDRGVRVELVARDEDAERFAAELGRPETPQETADPSARETDTGTGQYTSRT